jgi:hypothetical protein
VGHHQDLLTGDLPRGLQPTVEHDVERGGALAMVEGELTRRKAALASSPGEPRELLLAEGDQGRDLA